VKNYLATSKAQEHFYGISKTNENNILDCSDCSRNSFHHIRNHGYCLHIQQF